MAQQNIFTLISPLVSDDAKIATLKGLLNRAGDDLMNNPIVNFREAPANVHFLRWVVLSAVVDAQGRPIAPSLVYSVCCDGELLPHLSDLVKKFRKSLDQVYAFSPGYPSTGGDQDIIAYLKGHAVPYAAGYCGTPFRDLAQIRLEDDLYNFLQQTIDKNRAKWGNSATASQVRAELLKSIEHSSFTSTKPVDYWLGLAARQTASFWSIIGFVVVVSILLLIGLLAWALHSPGWKPYAVLGLLGAGITFLVYLALRLQWAEQTDAEATIHNLPALYAVLARREDRSIAVQNQMTHLVNIKPGWLRLLVLRGFLWIINLAAKYIFNKGKLGDIPTIHFAHWCIIDQGRRLIFFSNFDGSWESYLGDFIDKASVGLTGIWSNTVGFPRARWLILDGATNESLFKNWTRNNQIETQFWYSAYPLLTVRNINKSSAIRAGLKTKTTALATNRWLRLFD